MLGTELESHNPGDALLDRVKCPYLGGSRAQRKSSGRDHQGQPLSHHRSGTQQDFLHLLKRLKSASLVAQG